MTLDLVSRVESDEMKLTGESPGALIQFNIVSLSKTIVDMQIVSPSGNQVRNLGTGR